MRKSTKLAILVAALVALCTMAAFAADTWKQDGDNWYCYDKDGTQIFGESRKSGDNYYFLDASTGAMVRNSVQDEGTKKYYYGADGARVIDKWVQVPVENDGDGWEWMYFKAVSGAAQGYGDYATGDFVTVKGKKYLFSSEGYMLYGYLADKAGTKADDVIAANFYMGEKSDGSQFTGWLKFTDGVLGGEYADSSLVYFYFKKGAKITSADLDKTTFQIKIDGKYYTFGDDGHLITGVIKASESYYGAADDGSFKKKVWVKSNVPEKTGDDSYWYYYGSDGKLTKADAGSTAQIKKINSKYYLISTEGRLKSGLVVMKNTDPVDPLADKQSLVVASFATWKKFTDYKLGDNECVYYFNTTTDTDGTMKTGSVVVTIDGEEKTLVFDKHGVAYNGIVSKKIYNSGILQTAGDAKYAVVQLNKPEDATTGTYTKDYYLVNAAGAIMNNTRVVDADGIYWAVKDYWIYKFNDVEYAANASSAWKNGKTGFKVGSQWYKIEANPEKSSLKYTFMTWSKVASDPDAK